MSLLLVCLLIAGCSADPTPGVAGTPGYPAPEGSGSGYPVLATTTPIPNALPMVLDRPVKANDTTVSGSGPAGLVISIINVTTMGDVLGSGVIGPDNRFMISVQPLEGGVRIGILLDDTGSTDFVYEHYYSDDYKGPGAISVPHVGFMHDTELVER